MRALSLAFWFTLALGLVLVGVALVTQNSEATTIHLFSWESPTYPKWLVMVLAFLAGVIISTLYFIFEIISLEAKNIRLRRNFSQLERVVKSKEGEVKDANITEMDKAEWENSPSV